MGSEWVDPGSGPGWPLGEFREFTDEEKAKLKAQEPVDPPEDEPVEE